MHDIAAGIGTSKKFMVTKSDPFTLYSSHRASCRPQMQALLPAW